MEKCIKFSKRASRSHILYWNVTSETEERLEISKELNKLPLVSQRFSCVHTDLNLYKNQQFDEFG